MVSEKQCSKCGEMKPFTEFDKSGKPVTNAFGLNSHCKVCKKKERQIRSSSRPDREEYLARRRFEANHRYATRTDKEKLLARNRERWHNVSEASLAKRRAARRASQAKRMENINSRLACRLRTRIGMAIKSDAKRGSAVQDLGCTIAELKVHLETQFQPHMTWENYGHGKGRWNIDHIEPLVAFDLSDREQFLQAVHYSNLQPLWFEQNLEKRKDDLKMRI